MPQNPNLPIVQAAPLVYAFDPARGDVLTPFPVATVQATPQVRGGGITHREIARLESKLKKLIKASVCCPPSVSGQSDLTASPGTQTIPFPSTPAIVGSNASVVVYSDGNPGDVVVTATAVVITPSSPGLIGHVSFTIDVVDEDSDGGLFFFALRSACGCETLLGQLLLSSD